MTVVLKYLFTRGASQGDITSVYTRSSSYTSDESAIRGVLPDEHTIAQAGRVVWRRDQTLTPEEALDKRLRDAGMLTVPEMMGITPMTRWEVQQGMDSIEFFAKWLDRRAAEFLRMRLPFELGDKDDDHELYEWVFAHAAAYHEVRVQLRAAMAGVDARQEELRLAALQALGALRMSSDSYQPAEDRLEAALRAVGCSVEAHIDPTSPNS